MSSILRLSILLLAVVVSCCKAFSSPSSIKIPSAQQIRYSSTTLSAKKTKKKRGSSGEGFGTTTTTTKRSNNDNAEQSTYEDTASSSMPLQSINTQQPQTQTKELNLEGLSPEERSQTILKEKFGLKSYEEQQADLGDYRALNDAEDKKKKRTILRNLDNAWPENKGFVDVLPPSLIKGIDSVLKLGLGVCTVLFVLAGVLITIEAGSKAGVYEIPIGLEEFVVNVVQPNFTPGLGVLLGFSITLGIFSIGIGSSASSAYREDP